MPAATAAPGRQASPKPMAPKPGAPQPVASKFSRSNQSRSDAPKLSQPLPEPKPEPKVLFQKYFKSVGPRTYVAQVKQAGNGNHFLVLTEGKRDPKTDELRKCSLYLFSEDFEQFKDLLRDTFKFIADHPLPPDVREKREKFWANARKKKN